MELKECINYLLTTAQHNVFQYLSQRLNEYDVTPSQYGVLNCLWSENGKSSPKQIADSLKLETSTISGILDRMQKKNLVDRIINIENRREILVIITEKGWKLKDPIIKIIDEVNYDILNEFSEEENDILKKALTKIAERKI